MTSLERREATMRRRDFISLVGGAVALPLAVRAESIKNQYRIAFLTAGLKRDYPPVTEFFDELSRAGYVEGQNIVVEFLSTEGKSERRSEIARDAVRGNPDAIFVVTGPLTQHVRDVTPKIPIACVTSDPVALGLTTSLARPSGNVTGINLLSSELMGKRLSLLLEVAPQSTTVGYLSGPAGAPVFEELTGKVLAAAQALGREIVVLKVRPDADFTEAFATIAERQAGALLVGNFTSFADARHVRMIVELAARHKIPTVYPSRLYTSFGGLMSYSPDLIDVNRQLGIQYVGRILKGAKPADLPIQQPTKFELVINLKTAKALGLTVPDRLLAIADEVIE